MDFSNKATVEFLILIVNIAAVHNHPYLREKDVPYVRVSLDQLYNNDFSFVALLDIIFIDGTKKTCTGTIIHDKVVMTAAHCFVLAYRTHLRPELSVSFVVVGTKLEFDSGYEKYMPIERVVYHPKHRQWIADLALVYTYGGLMDSTYGRVVEISDAKGPQSDVTKVSVFSWRRSNVLELLYDQDDPTTTSSWGAPTEPYRSEEEYRRQRHKGIRMLSPRNSYQSSTTTMIPFMYIYDENEKYENPQPARSPDCTMDYQNEGAENVCPYRISNKTNKFDSVSYYRKGLRRSVRRKTASLVIEDLNFLYTHICKNILISTQLNNAGSRKISDNPDDYICYSSDAERDIQRVGAPAILHGRLLGITLGAINSAGSYIGIAMKTLTFCRWIFDNLPDDAELKCGEDVYKKTSETEPPSTSPNELDSTNVATLETMDATKPDEAETTHTVDTLY